MSISIPLLILRTILLGLSFSGLCAVACEDLKLNRFIAPFFCACTIICTLMAAGMLHGLEYGFYLIYFGGFACLARSLLKHWKKPFSCPFGWTDAAAIFTGTALLGYLIYRLWHCHLYLPDDLAHWGVVAKYLLANDALPDASAAAVTFSSYPTGSAVFIYYICRTLTSFEGIWMIAQSMLMFLLFLPVLAHVRENAKRVLPLIPAAFLVLFKFDRPMTTLCVDWLLSFLFFGATAAILYYKNDLPRALLIAVPAAIAAVYIKSSGFFFAACIALTVCLACRPKRRGAIVFAAILGSAVAAYLLWTLHISLSYPAALESKHAVSLSAYAEELASKSGGLILLILKKMILTWLRPSDSQIFTLLGVILAFVCIQLADRGNPRLNSLRRSMLKLFGFSFAAYAMWFIMLFAMYVFSMPEGEARSLAAYPRYNSTGLSFVLGMSLIALLRFFSDGRLNLARGWQKHICAAMGILSLAAAPLLMLDMPEFTLYPFYYDLAQHDAGETEYRTLPKSLLESGKIAEGGKYLICCGTLDDSDYILETYYNSRFELDTADLTILARLTDSESDTPWLAKSLNHRVDFASPADYLAEHMDAFDAVLIYREDAEFDSALDSFLKTYSGSTPIIPVYQ